MANQLDMTANKSLHNHFRGPATGTDVRITRTVSLSAPGEDHSRTPTPKLYYGLGADLLLTFAPVWWRKKCVLGNTHPSTDRFLSRSEGLIN